MCAMGAPECLPSLHCAISWLLHTHAASVAPLVADEPAIHSTFCHATYNTIAPAMLFATRAVVQHPETLSTYAQQPAGLPDGGNLS